MKGEGGSHSSDNEREGVVQKTHDISLLKMCLNIVLGKALCQEMARVGLTQKSIKGQAIASL